MAHYIRELALSPGDGEAISAWCRGMEGDPYAFDTRAYDAKLVRRIDELPASLLGATRDFADNAGSAGVLFVRGLPVPGHLPATPIVPYAQIGEATGTEAISLAISCIVGQAISMRNVRGGARVHNIYPLPNDAGTQKASNSVRLEMHTEMAFHREAPRALAIMCLRAGHQPPATGFCDLYPIWDDLNSTQQTLLMSPAFGFGCDRQDPRLNTAAPQPIAAAVGKKIVFQYDSAVRGTTPAHEAALETLRNKVDETATELTLAPGDLVLIDNAHVVHGRSPFGPSFGGGDRWLQRCLIGRPAAS